MQREEMSAITKLAIINCWIILVAVVGKQDTGRVDGARAARNSSSGSS